jgi:hypothetical protein
VLVTRQIDTFNTCHASSVSLTLSLLVLGVAADYIQLPFALHDLAASAAYFD